MSDNLRRYRAIRRALIQCYPDAPTGKVVRHLTPLAALSSGIVGSHSQQNLRSPRRNNRQSKQVARLFLSLGSKSFRLKFSRCC
jgi:hypothetical protein